ALPRPSARAERVRRPLASAAAGARTVRLRPIPPRSGSLRTLHLDLGSAGSHGLSPSSSPLFLCPPTASHWEDIQHGQQAAACPGDNRNQVGDYAFCPDISVDTLLDHLMNAWLAVDLQRVDGLGPCVHLELIANHFAISVSADGGLTLPEHAAHGHDSQAGLR